MRKIDFVNELLNLSSVLSMHHIQWWLMKYEKEFYKAINNSECRKWSKWLDTNEKPFPCVCDTRAEDCIFIESYYKLNNVFGLHKKQEYFIKLGFQYQSIKNNKAELKAFTNYLNSLGLNLTFDSKIIISLKTEPYKKIIFQLNENEFENVIRFQNIYFNKFQ